ncbi:MAG: glycosyltransferase family 4 protein [Candidatus Gastranaerophilaceae bacterium]
MKVAFFIDDFTKDGGTEKCTAVLANLLAERGIDITIMSVNASNNKIKFNLSSGIKVINFNKNKIINAVRRRIKTYKCLKKQIKYGAFDIIVVVDTYKALCFIPLLFMLYKCKTRLISWEHFNFDFGKKYSPRWWGRKVAAKISDAVVVLSKADFKNWKSNFKRIRNLKVIYNFSSFDLQKPHYNANKRNILAVGRLENQKGFDYLLDVWKYVENNSDLNEWTLQIVGSGSLENDLHLKEKNLGLNRIEWYPFTTNISEFYQNAAVYVMSSRFEGFALVLLEARAFGLPIISFDIKCGPSEIIEQNINGYLIKPFSVSEFADKLMYIMRNPDVMKAFTLNSQNNMDKFSKSKIVDKWIELFNDII